MYDTLTVSAAGSLEPGDIFKCFLSVPSASSFGPFTVLTVARTIGEVETIQITTQEYEHVMTFKSDTPVEILENV